MKIGEGSKFDSGLFSQKDREAAAGSPFERELQGELAKMEMAMDATGKKPYEVFESNGQLLIQTSMGYPQAFPNYLINVEKQLIKVSKLYAEEKKRADSKAVEADELRHNYSVISDMSLLQLIFNKIRGRI